MAFLLLEGVGSLVMVRQVAPRLASSFRLQEVARVQIWAHKPGNSTPIEQEQAAVSSSCVVAGVQTLCRGVVVWL
jgi:hypothetical protein